ncbi:metalloregulator ArsR/SmtB family transcription factor [Jiangella aurantiaca]|uniref:Metalloregulator ArsR/SmtB family transcription factor n=1 Tax=Jiangella aurantiaca TaxID=2530373 RepID=A0A4R4ZZI5_9ACTN|nr:metalloregulator ArsR/SmtB family transcription factor [Jiangella aurantiaca]TDD64888.1 metalloregulator ArsR/SmtB family transcription factor [Jiangella aurantiaca]
MTAGTLAHPDLLPTDDVARFAESFACLADPTRVRLLHAVATAPAGRTVGELTERLGISQSTCSHHVRKLAEAGFVHVDREGPFTRVTVNEACIIGLPHMADVVMGALATRPLHPEVAPAGITVRELRLDDWPAVRRIYQEGLDTGIASFDTTVPPSTRLAARWLPGHRWVAEIDGAVVGWTAVAHASQRESLRGVGETSVYVDRAHRGRGVGKALLFQQVTATDRAGIWMLQTSVFSVNRAGLSLHHQAGYRTVGVREKLGQRDGVWHDCLLLERRAQAAVPHPRAAS